MTSREFSCQNFMVYFSQGYHMSIHTKICDLWWPQMTSWVKIILPSGSRISYENVCWKLGPWVHFSKLSIFDLQGFLGSKFIILCWSRVSYEYVCKNWVSGGHLKCFAKLTFYTFFKIRWHVLILKINKICPMTLLDIIEVLGWAKTLCKKTKH